jgi:RNA polymerase sigma factor (sigma-70 family)
MNARWAERPAAKTPATGDYERLAELLGSARDGDRSALNELIEALTPVLWQVARSQGLDQERAGDVVQTTWLTLLGSLSGIHTPVALTGWLITVTKREAWRLRDAHRAEQPMEDELRDVLPDQSPRPDDQAVAAEQRARLWAAVGQLPDRCRKLLRIVAFVHRPDYSQVSAALGMPRGGIGPTRGRCLAQLRALLSADPEGSWR